MWRVKEKIFLTEAAMQEWLQPRFHTMLEVEILHREHPDGTGDYLVIWIEPVAPSEEGTA